MENTQLYWKKMYDEVHKINQKLIQENKKLKKEIKKLPLQAIKTRK